jgi:hypothetical protein
VVYLNILKRPGKYDPFVIAVSDDPGRTRGTVAAVSGRTLTVRTFGGAKTRDVEVALDVEARILLDGRPSTAAEALKEGRSVIVWAPRRQAFELLPEAEAEPAAE